jgi:hypothetical protein
LPRRMTCQAHDAGRFPTDLRTHRLCRSRGRGCRRLNEGLVHRGKRARLFDLFGARGVGALPLVGSPFLNDGGRCINPAIAARLDKREAWYEARSNCISCCHECKCRNWLESEGLPVPPDFCPNVEFFQRCTEAEAFQQPLCLWSLHRTAHGSALLLPEDEP